MSKNTWIETEALLWNATDSLAFPSSSVWQLTVLLLLLLLLLGHLSGSRSLWHTKTNKKRKKWCCYGVWIAACYLTWWEQTETAGVCVFNPFSSSPLSRGGFPLSVYTQKCGKCGLFFHRLVTHSRLQVVCFYRLVPWCPRKGILQLQALSLISL